MRPSILVLFPLVLGGCCCGLGGGGGSGSSLTERIEEKVGEKVSDKVGETILEKTYEASTGHEMDVSGAGTKFSVETDDGLVTTTMDGSLPEGFPCTLPPGITVTMGTRLEPKDATKTQSSWGLTYTTSESWDKVAAYWMAEGTKCGFDEVTSAHAEIEAAIKEAAAQGVTVPAGSMGTETGDMIGLSSTKDSKMTGGVVIDGSTPGTTSVTATFTR